jgi:Ala-tRNA(Pro) deacylase
MSGQKIKEYLKSHQVPYETILHPQAFSAQKIAHTAHIPGSEMAKTVILKIDGRMGMFVTGANERIDMRLIRKYFNASSVELADENEFKYLFGDCEAGAMPPFGSLYDMEEYISEGLMKDREIAFNAGNHTELIRMKFSDFKRLAHAKVLKMRR